MRMKVKLRGLVSKHLIPGLDIYSLKKISAGTQTRNLQIFIVFVTIMLLWFEMIRKISQ